MGLGEGIILGDGDGIEEVGNNVGLGDGNDDGIRLGDGLGIIDGELVGIGVVGVTVG